MRIVGIEAAPGEFPPQFALNRPLVHMTPALSHFLGEDEHEALLVRLHEGSASVDDFLAELDERGGGLPPQVEVSGLLSNPAFGQKLRELTGS